VNVGEILKEVYIDLDYDEIPPLSVTERLKGYIRRAYGTILREPDLSLLRDTTTPLTFVSVLGQTVYGLPSQIARPVAITDRTNNRLLTPMSLVDLRLNDPGMTSTGTPWAWVPLGYGPAQGVPMATGLWVASASALDTTQTVLLNGVRVNGLATGDLTAKLNGLARVPIGTITDLVDVQHLSLNATAVGVVSIYDAATAGTVIAQIGIGRLAPRYFRVLLYPQTDVGITYYVDGQLHIPELDDDQDVPLLPPDFHTLLITGALMHEYKRKDDTSRIVTLAADWARGLDRLKHHVSATATEIPVKGQRVTRRFSRFGSWTPADW
jgi:hypothetical protein